MTSQRSLHSSTTTRSRRRDGTNHGHGVAQLAVGRELTGANAFGSEIFGPGKLGRITFDEGRVVMKNDSWQEAIAPQIISAAVVKIPHPAKLVEDGGIVVTGGWKLYVVGDKIIGYLAPCYGGRVSIGTPIFLGVGDQPPTLEGMIDASGAFSIRIAATDRSKAHYLYCGGKVNGSRIESGSLTIRCALRLPQRETDQAPKPDPQKQ